LDPTGLREPLDVPADTMDAPRTAPRTFLDWLLISSSAMQTYHKAKRLSNRLCKYFNFHGKYCLMLTLQRQSKKNPDRSLRRRFLPPTLAPP
jgi:hypothetical protein